MSDLKLDSLRIQNFRTFRDLTIDRLGRVNLIVGKNNVGKTALLEAVRVWAERGAFSTLWEILEDRQETTGHTRASLSFRDSRVIDAVRHLFYGWPKSSDEHEFYIGPKDRQDLALQVRYEFLEASEDTSIPGAVTPILRISHHFETRTSKDQTYELKEDLLRENVLRREIDSGDGCPTIHIGARGISKQRLLHLGNQIIFKGSAAEKRVRNALRTIDETIQDVRFIPVEANGEREGIALVETKHFEGRIPLGSLGDGMTRMLDFAVALEGARDGILLIDEIENGLHYSVQPDLWRMIFETAQELDVQVFATTHSHDCVKAFQQVSEEHSEEGMLIQLRRKRSDPEDIVAVTVDEEELQDSLQFQVDPR